MRTALLLLLFFFLCNAALVQATTTGCWDTTCPAGTAEGATYDRAGEQNPDYISFRFKCENGCGVFLGCLSQKGTFLENGANLTEYFNENCDLATACFGERTATTETLYAISNPYCGAATVNPRTTTTVPTTTTTSTTTTTTTPKPTTTSTSKSTSTSTTTKPTTTSTSSSTSTSTSTTTTTTPKPTTTSTTTTTTPKPTTTTTKPPPKCPIKNEKGDGTLENLILEVGKEQYCPSGETLKFARGAPVKEIKCTDEGLQITAEDGGVITYTSSNPPTLKCFSSCPIRNWLPSGALGNAVIEEGKEQYCPSGQIVAFGDGKPLNDIKCTRSALVIEKEDGTILSYPKPLTRATLKCVPGVCKEVCAGPTTTTTTTTAAPTTTTTTIKPDSPPTADQLWNMKYYYNPVLILHAFCADQNCYNVIQSNGIGYEPVTYSGLVGRAIREDAIAAVRVACPTGSANLRNLGFTKVGNHYEHNFNGAGLKQGWVSIVYGACGATVPIKRWKCHFSEDLMYKIDLEENTYYKGLVQDGGRVQFYMY